VYRAVVVERSDARQDVGFAGGAGKAFMNGFVADGLGDLALVADVDLARRVVADEDCRKSRNDAVRRFQLGGLGRNAGAQRRRECFAVYDLGRQVRRRI